VNERAEAPNTAGIEQSSHKRVTLGVLALLVCIAALALIRFELVWTPATLALIVAAIVVASQLPAPPKLVAAAIGSPPIGRPSPGSRALAFAGFGLAAAGGINLMTAWYKTFDWAAPLLLLGMCVWTVGLAIGDRSRAGWLRPEPLTSTQWLLFGAIIVLDLFFRFYNYSHFPPPGGFCSVEEAFTGRTAMYVLADGQRPWEFIGDVWLPVPFFHFFGPSTTTLRLGFTVVSALTVPALFLLVRELVSIRAALVTGTLFAVARWHVIYGRHAHNIFATILVVVLIFYLCVRIHRRGGLAAYPWLGFLTGYTLYTYAGFRSLPVYAGLFVLLSLATHLRAERGREEWSRPLRVRFVGLGLAALGLILSLLPLAGRLHNNPMFLFEAAFRSTVVNPNFRQGSSEELWQAKLQQADSALKLFNHRGDDSEVFNLAPYPMLDPVTGLLLVIGAAYCAWQPARRFQGYFLAIGLMQLGLGAVAVGHLDVRRLASIIPFIFVLTAFAVDGLIGFFEVRGSVSAKKRVNLLLIVLACAAVIDNYRVYVGGMMQSQRTRWAFQTDFSSTTRYMHTLPADAYMLLVSNMLNFFMDNDYAWVRRTDVPGSVTSDLTAVLAGEPGPWSGDGKQLHLFIVDPYEHDELAPLVRRAIPEAECQPFAGGDTPPWQRYTTCKLPVDYKAIPVEPTLSARYYYGDESDAVVERKQRALSYALYPDQCRLPLGVDRPPCRAEFDGVWNVDKAGIYQLLAEAQGGQLSLTIDGVPITDKPIDLTAGAHEIRGSAKFETQFEAGARLKVRPNGTEEWRLVPFEAP